MFYLKFGTYAPLSAAIQLFLCPSAKFLSGANPIKMLQSEILSTLEFDELILRY